MAAKKKTEVVADQPTAAPSRKMEGVIAGAPSGAALGAIIIWALGPDVAGLFVPDNIELAIMAICTASVPIAAGYFRKERVVAQEP